MPPTEFHLVVALTAGMAGVGTLFLGLVVLDLIGAAVRRLWLSLSPDAARQARFRAALAASQGSFSMRGTPIWRSR